MPRPKGKLNRKHILRVRVTAAEMEQIRSFADGAKLTISDYVRKRALRFAVKSRYDETMINELRRVGGLLKSEALKLPAERRGPSWGILKLMAATVMNINKVATRELAWSKDVAKGVTRLRAEARQLEELASDIPELNATAVIGVARRITDILSAIESVVAIVIEDSLLARIEDR